MKLIDLLNTFDTAMPFAITYNNITIRYDNTFEIVGDDMCYELCGKDVTLIWNSQNLYRCIVIEIE